VGQTYVYRKTPLKVFLCHSSQDKPIVRELPKAATPHRRLDRPLAGRRETPPRAGIIKPMNRTLPTNLKIDRKAFSVISLTDVSDEKAYWLARTPYERLRQVEILRRINYGTRATARLQRVLEITEREVKEE